MLGIWRYKDIKTTQQRGSTRCWGFGAIRISKPRSNEDLRGVGIWRYKDIKTTQQRGAATRIYEDQQRGAATRSSNEEQQRGAATRSSNEDLRGVGGFGAIRISKPRSNEDLRGVGDLAL